MRMVLLSIHAFFVHMTGNVIQPKLSVQEPKRASNVQASTTSTKWYIGQLDKPIEKVVDEGEEVITKKGLGKVDLSLKL